MTNKKRTHYRSAYKSDHLCSADLEEMEENGQELIFTIEKVVFYPERSVAGRKIKCNVAFFKEKIKPMVVNAKNADTLRSFIKSSFIEDWTNLSLTIELYSAKLDRDFNGHSKGVRIKLQQPQKKEKGKKAMSPNGLVKAMDSIRKGGHTKKQIIDGYSLSKEQLTKIKSI